MEDWTRINQRALLYPDRLAREYKPSDISPVFKANGTLNPGTDEYNAHVAQGFANWRLKIDGMVANPLSLSVAELRRLPSRTQITKHDCVEGWTAIGMWTGVPLGLLLKSAGIGPRARYAVFHCIDDLSGEPVKGGEQSPGLYYESIDLVDAFHPQTIIAYAMNGKPWMYPMAPLCACAWSASWATSTQNTSSELRLPTHLPPSQAGAAAIGKTAAMNGMREFERPPV